MIDLPIFRGIWSSLLPQHCLICGDFFLGVGACSICFSLLKRRLPPLCEGCGRSMPPEFSLKKCPDCSLHPPWLDRFSAAFDYEPICGALLRYIKSSGQPKVLADILSRHNLTTQTTHREHFDFIIPIPDRRSRYIQRGFSVTRMVAQQLARQRSIAVKSGVLSWRRTVAQQTGMSRKMRQTNMKGAFRAKSVKGQRLLLVDDVYTTGATLNEASKVLKKAGALRVEGFALCSKRMRNHGGKNLIGLQRSRSVPLNPTRLWLHELS